MSEQKAKRTRTAKTKTESEPKKESKVLSIEEAVVLLGDLDLAIAENRVESSRLGMAVAEIDLEHNELVLKRTKLAQVIDNAIVKAQNQDNTKAEKIESEQ